MPLTFSVRGTNLSSLQKVVEKYLNPLAIALPSLLLPFLKELEAGGSKRQARSFVDS